MNQERLWHDTPEEALRALVAALGGPKRVGNALMPDLSMDDARRAIDGWCSADRKQKPALSQLMWLMKEGRRAGCHVLIEYFAAETGYRVEPVEPEDERAELQRKFIAAIETADQLAKEMKRRDLRSIDRGAA